MTLETYTSHCAPPNNASQAARLAVHNACRSQRSLEWAQQQLKRTDAESRSSHHVQSLAQVKRHCNALQEAVDAIVEVVASLHTARRDSVDYTNLGSWVAAFSHHVPPLVDGVRRCAASSPVVATRQIAQKATIELCEGVKRLLKGMWRALQPDRSGRLATVGSSKADVFSHQADDTHSHINALLRALSIDPSESNLSQRRPPATEKYDKLGACGDLSRDITGLDVGLEAPYDNPHGRCREGFTVDVRTVQRTAGGGSDIDGLEDLARMLLP